jgi:ABC-type lipopolysaccharide export system ATPase subunit
MKIRFANLGNLKSGEIDLKPLTVCIGPNNTGKTYSAYCIYGILDPAIVPFYADHTDLNLFDEFINELTERGYVEVDLEKIIKNYTNLILNDLCRVFVEEAIYKFMQTSKKMIFDNTKIVVALSDDDLNFMLNNLVDFEIRKGFSVTEDKELIVTEKKKNEKILRIYTRVEDEKDREVINRIFTNKNILKSIVIGGILSVILGCIRKKMAVLPAERLALVTLYRYLGKRGIKIADLISEEDFENAEWIKDLIRNIMFVSYKYPKPIKDFIEFLDNLDKISEEFENNEKLKEMRKDFVCLSELIENEILRGRIVLEKKEKIAIPILEFEVEDGKRLDLHITSTAVKELAGLVLYFRYLIEKNDYLIIDEPEMNLHPEAQIKLLEIITMAVNKGVNVILTTHSPYIVDHLMNLMEGYDVKDKIDDKSLGDYLYLGYRDSFISPKKVGAYFFSEDGRIADILNVEERIIDWETFSKVSERLGVIYEKLCEIRKEFEEYEGKSVEE